MSFFVHDRPVGGTANFAGRAHLLRNLEQGLAAGRSMALLGGVKTGRTSTLYEIAHRTRQSWLRPTAPTKVVPVYVDCANAAARLDELPRSLWTAIRAAVLDPHVQTHASPPRPPLELGHGPDRWARLAGLCDTLWEGLANTPGWCRYVLLLDNADLLFDAAAHGAQKSLADFLAPSDAPARPRAAVLAGGPRLHAALERPRSLWAGLRSQLLGVLRDNEALALARAGGLTDESAAACISDSGRHPYVLQRLLALVGDETQESVDPSALLAADFAAMLKAITPAGRVTGAHALSLMGLLCDYAGAPLSVSEAARMLHVGSLRRLADILVMAAVVERTVRGSEPSLRAPGALWNAYVRAAG